MNGFQELSNRHVLFHEVMSEKTTVRTFCHDTDAVIERTSRSTQNKLPSGKLT